jgi:hypothetical protein
MHVPGRMQTLDAPLDGKAGIGRTCTQVHYFPACLMA